MRCVVAFVRCRWGNAGPGRAGGDGGPAGRAGAGRAAHRPAVRQCLAWCGRRRCHADRLRRLWLPGLPQCAAGDRPAPRLRSTAEGGLSRAGQQAQSPRCRHDQLSPSPDKADWASPGSAKIAGEPDKDAIAGALRESAAGIDRATLTLPGEDPYKSRSSPSSEPPTNTFIVEREGKAVPSWIIGDSKAVAGVELDAVRDAIAKARTSIVANDAVSAISSAFQPPCGHVHGCSDRCDGWMSLR